MFVIPDGKLPEKFMQSQWKSCVSLEGRSHFLPLLIVLQTVHRNLVMLRRKYYAEDAINGVKDSQGWISGSRASFQLLQYFDVIHSETFSIAILGNRRDGFGHARLLDSRLLEISDAKHWGAWSFQLFCTNSSI